jgi:type III restriction enzyme
MRRFPENREDNDIFCRRHRTILCPEMIEAHEAQLLALLAEHHSLGNGKARELLGWDEATYAQVKEALVASGQVVLGPGRGGSIKLGHDPAGQTSRARDSRASRKDKVKLDPMREIAYERPGVENIPAREPERTGPTATDKDPILNDPYQEPELYYHTHLDGRIDYNTIRTGRRTFTPDIPAVPERAKGQRSVFDAADFSDENNLVNLTRAEVRTWRLAGYPNVTRVTRDLLQFWFDEEKAPTSKLFFAQREAVETAIWLNEVAERSNAGQNVLRELRQAQVDVSEELHEQLPRIAFKMATGTGKTVVMAALILYHYLNRREYRSDTRFADHFLVVAPGITIRDRLGVLRVDEEHRHDKQKRKDYYSERSLVPPQYNAFIDGLNANLVITNYHAFMPRTLQGNKKSPFDGKIGADGKKQEALESFDQVLRRVMGNLKPGRRLLVLNDEAHHCYKPKSAEKANDDFEEHDENERAAVWFTGLAEIAKRYKLTHVYDLSATPYYLKGSGYEPYSLYGWVVSDFGLIEAIESGLVKIPFLPISDDTQELTEPVLKHLYEHVRSHLPRKGQRKQKSEAKEKGGGLLERLPELPELVKGALDQFYTHYSNYTKGLKEAYEQRNDLFSRPPVFIAVCQNTSVSKELFKYIAGFEYEDEKGNRRVYKAALKDFSNFDDYDRPKQKAPTLLIDSDALEAGEQISDEFRKVFSAEIAEFKKEYARLYGQGAAEQITDGDLLREVVNTVGRPGKLGAHIRCVVSVSMLTEGWDANTVTHIMGLRAFGSQLLCEQVAGRALRRREYFLQGYDKDGQPTDDPKKAKRFKFPPEYAHIIGVPFKMFRGGGGQQTLAMPAHTEPIKALEERQAVHEIRFPNVDGYRKVVTPEVLKHDFSKLAPFAFDGSKFPLTTEMGSAFSGGEEKMRVSQILEKRDQEIVFTFTGYLIRRMFGGDQDNSRWHLFARLRDIVQEWYDTKIKLLNIVDPVYRKLVFFANPVAVCDHIMKGINPERDSQDFVRPVLNPYNPMGSTTYVNGHTSRETFPTAKSHVNAVAMDSKWEGICAKTLEELEPVVSYVKNHFLGFEIPYLKEGRDHKYRPDFIVRLKLANGTMANLIIEITGMDRDKKEKTWYVRNRWLPAVNAVRHEHGMDPWHFTEVAGDIRDIKNDLTRAILAISSQAPEEQLRPIAETEEA